MSDHAALLFLAVVVFGLIIWFVESRSRRRRNDGADGSTPLESVFDSDGDSGGDSGGDGGGGDGGE